MKGHAYINKVTRIFSQISDHKLDDDNLEEVKTLPPSALYKFVDNNWLPLSAEELPAPDEEETESGVFDYLTLPILTQDPEQIPPVGNVLLYRKNDGKWYEKTSAGEIKLIEGKDEASGGSGGGQTYPPIISKIYPDTIDANTTRTIQLTGELFSLGTTVKVDGTMLPNSAVTFISAQEISFQYTAGAKVGGLSLEVDNGSDSTILDPGLQVRAAAWKALGTGGFEFTHGNEAGKQIRYRDTLDFHQDGEGIWWTLKEGAKQNNWLDPWVKFEFLSWQRKIHTKSIKFVFSLEDKRFCIGIGSTEMNESGNFWQQPEIQIYANHSGAIAFVGNKGNLWEGAYSNIGQSFKTKYHRIEIDNNGAVGQMIRIYDLPDISPENWDNTDNLTVEAEIPAAHTADASNIMPMIVPWLSDVSKIAAIQVN